jgi:hypothetical protein
MKAWVSRIVRRVFAVGLGAWLLAVALNQTP